MKSDLRIERLAIDDPAFRGTLPHAGASHIKSTELRERTGIEPYISDELYPGVYVSCEAYACRLGDTFVFGIHRSLEGHNEGTVEICTHRADQIAIVALALDLPDGWFSWRAEPDQEIPRPWQVFRQDDNGNQFELARLADEHDAWLLVKLWDNKIGTHKQSAFVKR